MVSSDRTSLTFSECLANSNDLAESNGLLACLSENVGKPLANAALIEPWNAAASSFNDLAGLVSKPKLAPELSPFALKQRAEFSTAWWAQGISTGVGTIAPLAATILVTKAGLNGMAGKSETVLAKCLRAQSTATIAGAGIYDGLRKPHEGETRLGNALGGATGFAIFEGGNHLSRKLPGPLNVGLRAITGALGATAHSSTAEYLNKGTLPESEKLKTSALTGATVNMIMPMVLGRFLKDKGHSGTTTDSVSEVASKSQAEQGLSTVLPGESSARGLLPASPGEGAFSFSQRPSGLLVPESARLVVSTSDQSIGARHRVPVRLATGAGGRTCYGEPFTMTRLGDDSILDFYGRVREPLTSFRGSAEFPALNQQYRLIIQQGKDLGRAARDFLDEVNAKKYACDQIPLEKLSDDVSMRATLGPFSPHLPAYEGLLQRNAQLKAAAREFLRRSELKTITSDLGEAVNFLGDELGTPRMRVRLSKLIKNRASYADGTGVETVDALAVFQGKPSALARSLGHESAHGYQDFVMMARIADKLGIGSEFSVGQMRRLQTVCSEELTFRPTDKWTRAVLQMRGGQRLTDDLSGLADQMMNRLHMRGQPTMLELDVKGAARYFENPKVSTPVTNFLTQLQDEWYVKDAVFRDGRVPPVVSEMQARFAAGQAVETAANRSTLAQYFKDLAKELSDESYARYRRAPHELDAWGFDQKIGDVLKANRRKP